MFLIDYLSNHLLLSVLVLSVALIAVPVYRVTFHPLAGFPGPISWSISRLPWHFSMHNGRLHRDLYEIHQKYGNVVRVAPNELSCTHPDAYRDIHGTRPGHKMLPRNNIWFERPKDELKAEKVTSIMDWDEAGHARIRRAFASAFTESGVKEVGPVVMKHVDLMIKQLTKVLDRAEANGQSDVVIDLVDWFSFTTFDIGGELSFGEGFGSIEAEKAHPWVDINNQFGKGLAMITSLGFLWPLNRVFALLIPKRVKEKFVYHRQLTQERVGKRLVEGQGKADFVGAIEKHNEECEAKNQPEKTVSRAELDLNMTVLVFAGSETTSTALSGIFRYLLQDGQKMQKLKKTITNEFKQEHDITTTTITHLEYVDAVLQEGMRLAPPVAIIPPRMMPPGGEEVCGRHIPEKTLVSVCPFPSNRSSENFSRPEEFIPERFLSESKFPGDNLQAFQPFAVGRHMCLGYRLAWLMLRLILVRLLYAFEMEMVEDLGDYGQQKTFILWEKEPLMVKLTKRNHDHSSE